MPGDGTDRSVGLRQVDLPAAHQPHERPDPRHPAAGRDPARRRGHLRSEGGRRRPPAPRRDGLPALEPVPEVDLRERRLRTAGARQYAAKATLDEIVESTLHRAALWDEVKDRLGSSALSLSGGQQQRLCIARALAVEPEVLLMDEPASALDPLATAKIEELIHELKERYTIIIVTHNMQQAARVSDMTAYFYLGRLVEFGATATIFTNPERVRRPRTTSRDASAEGPHEWHCTPIDDTRSSSRTCASSSSRWAAWWSARSGMRRRPSRRPTGRWRSARSSAITRSTATTSTSTRSACGCWPCTSRPRAIFA